MYPPQKPYSPACDENKEPILAVLREVWGEPGQVLEVGAGTGQHAVHFAKHLPHLTWQPTSLPEDLSGMKIWLAEANLPNLRAPWVLDVTRAPWPVNQVDGVYSANTTHIMSWHQVQALFRGIGLVLAPAGRFCLYGPFNYGGQYTSPSNARFDALLKSRDPESGIRDFDALDALARDAGLVLVRDYPMPANNRTLVWRKA
jgi:SAM-dependent methyltransferase